MKPHDFDMYSEASRDMDASEFRKLQLWMGLSNAEMAQLLHCSVSAVEAYRSDAAWHRNIPHAIAGLLRIIEIDLNKRERHRNNTAIWKKNNPGKAKEINKRAVLKHYYKNRKQKPKLSDSEKKTKIREYNRAYARYRRTSDRSMLDEFYKKYGAPQKTAEEV